MPGSGAVTLSAGRGEAVITVAVPLTPLAVARTVAVPRPDAGEAYSPF